MERTKWLIEKRKKAIERYDTIFSVDYDDNWGYIEEEHKVMVQKYIDLLPQDAYILDAACGTGKYWSILKNYSINVKGIDQSYEMLKKAQTKCQKYEIEKLGLQEIDEKNTYEGIMCIDAMENVFPEDWDNVLKNFYNALTKDGILYFTVETISKEEKDIAFRTGKEKGLPILYGEVAHEGGYHYYPNIECVKSSFKNKGFNIIEESISEGYQHFIIKKI